MKLAGLIDTSPPLAKPSIINKYQNPAFNQVKANLHIGQSSAHGTITGRYGNRWVARNEKTGISKFFNGS